MPAFPGTLAAAGSCQRLPVLDACTQTASKSTHTIHPATECWTRQPPTINCQRHRQTSHDADYSHVLALWNGMIMSNNEQAPRGRGGRRGRPPVRAGLGRGRITVSGNAAEAEGEGVVTSAKRPRGRPRKEELLEEQRREEEEGKEGEEEDVPAPKRRRGRPRKEEQRRAESPSFFPALSDDDKDEDEQDEDEKTEDQEGPEQGPSSSTHTFRAEEQMANNAAPEGRRFEALMRKNLAVAIDAGLESAERYYKRVKPRVSVGTKDLIDRMVGPPEPAMRTGWTQALEDEVQAQWAASDEKRSLEAASWIERVIALWKVSLQLFRCSPVAIMSPAYNLWIDASNPGEVFWPVTFCEALSHLVAHPIWRGNKALLRRAIQLAVACRTDNRASWTMDQPEMCGAIVAIAQFFLVDNREHAPKHWVEQAFKEVPNGKVACPEACFLRHLATVCSPKKPQRTDDTRFLVRRKDLVNITKAVETFGEGFFPSTNSVPAMYYAYLAARSGHTAPVGEARTKELHGLAWKHEMRRAKRRELGLPFDDASMALDNPEGHAASSTRRHGPVVHGNAQGAMGFVPQKQPPAPPTTSSSDADEETSESGDTIFMDAQE
ncbi:hypothetical protein PCL_06650 [Purpureocillium lilacinum]|uniref:Uncharacterized protein n=1 Tax=Purpureocillium lilacinum TaxID=33203 RepID=A0A2U3END0_PURLI|nr:hypothetical protein Purlil1_7693 [Purpureocillium lilacinum]PWI75992.1 hypothetical protein PCL_06650 [Purpureocillium lilacinum]